MLHKHQAKPAFAVAAGGTTSLIFLRHVRIRNGGLWVLQSPKLTSGGPATAAPPQEIPSPSRPAVLLFTRTEPEPTEHDFDWIALLVSELSVFDRRLAFLSVWDTCAYPVVLQRFSETVSVIARIPKKQFDVWQAAEQYPRQYNRSPAPEAIVQMDQRPTMH